MSVSSQMKGSVTKGGGKMNPVGTSGHQSSSASSSKTVAAILKQKDFKAAENMSAPRTQQMQQQFQKKRSSKSSPSSAAGLQDSLSYVKSVNSPMGLAGNTTPASLSPAMSPSNAPGVSPSCNKEQNHAAATTKSSSLSRELSPSRITAQIVKVMSDGSQSSTQNLLLSVLQGNMPDPMGILNPSKSDVTLASVGASSAQTSNHLISSSSRMPAVGKVSNLKHNSFNAIPSSLYDSGLFSPQNSTMEDGGSSPDSLSSLSQGHSSVVSNLLTASVNVSHIPKSTNIPVGLNPGGPLTSGHSLSSSSPRHSPRSAMEVAQQIKLEANGQSTSAHKAAMQQQLRSQIKGSRSLDAQLASRQSAGAPVAGPPIEHQSFNTSHQMHPIKEMEQQKQTLEASMPLLASKLSSVPSSSNISTSSSVPQHNSTSKTKQNLPLTASLLKSPLPSSTNSSNIQNFTLVHTSPLSPLSGRKTVHQAVSSQPKSTNNAADSRQHRQPSQQQPHQQLQKQLQQQNVPGMSIASTLEQVSVNESWLQSPKNAYLPMPVSSSMGLVGANDHGKQLMLQKLIQATDSSGLSDHTVQTDIVMKVEGQAQTSNLVSKHGRSVISNTASTPQQISSSVNKGKLSQSIKAVGIGGLAQTTLPSELQVAAAVERRRKSGPGESKQTAIDVDMDFGNLASIATDDQSISFSKLKYSKMLQGVGEVSIPQLVGGGKDVGDNKFNNIIYQQQSQSLQQPFIKALDGDDLTSLSNALFVKDITGVSNANGSMGDPSTFLPIHSSSSSLTSLFSKANAGALDISNDLLQTSDFYNTTSTSMIVSNATAGSVSNVLYSNNFNNPPPPYPSNKSHPSQHPQQSHLPQHHQQQQQIQLQHQQQQQQQQQQQHHHQQQRQQQPVPQQGSKSSTKHSMRNPFTFPTTGVTVQTGHDSSGILSYTINPQPPDVSGENKPYMVKNEPILSTMPAHRAMGALEKCQSDISYMSRLQSGVEDVKQAMPRLVPQSSFKGDFDFLSTFVKSEVNEPSEQQPVEQPFNQRVANLSCLPVNNTLYRAAYRSHAVAAQRARSGVITNTAKSLDVLRQNLQRSINKEIAEIIKRYTNKFFEPALANIRQNNNEDLLGSEHINYVCRQILEEAKQEYSASPSRRSVTPTTDLFDSVSDNGSISGKRSVNAKRSRISDSDSEKGSEAGSVRRTVKRKGRPPVHGSGRVTPSKPYKAGDVIKKEGPKWDPDRMKPETQYIMGAKANKALGLGNTRGRLYIRHPDIFKYVGDSEDKMWLCDRSLMPPTGGKAYLMLVEDIQDLSRTDDYRDSPSLLMHECVGFTVPEWMLVKMKEQMGAQRTDGPKRYFNSSEESETMRNLKPLPFSTFATDVFKTEAQPSPADTEDMDFLSTIDCEESRLVNTISPFNVTTEGFGDTGRGGGGGVGDLLSSANLAAIEEQVRVSTIFT